MGAESSSLRAIDSLNATLSKIEHKLGVIEDVHLHHERTICHDNVVIVSGKKILSNPGVDLVVGPILGLITQNSVRILLEADTTATLTVNFFVLDALHTEARFLCEDVIVVHAGQPVAKTFTGLVAETNYAVYIGGCRGQTTILNYASFATLPRSESRTEPRVLFAHGSRIDRAVPGEVNLWTSMNDLVAKGAKGRDAARHAAKHEGDTLHNQTVHMIIHMGNFLQVDCVIRARAVELLDMITREDVSVEEWDRKLNEAEEAVRTLYRNSLTSPDVRRLLRRCGHLFLSAEDEAGSLTSSFLGMAPGPVLSKTEDVKSKKKEKGANLGFRAQREAKAKEELAKAKALAKAKRGPLKRGEIDEDTIPVDTEEDLLVPAIGGAIRRQREAVSRDLDQRTQLNEELRILLLGSILRMLRRVNWAYARQLWDPNYEALVIEDTQIEKNQRTVLKVRKYLQVRMLLHSHLERTRKKLVQEFGEEYKASFDVAERCKTLTTEVEQLEEALRGHLTESALIIARSKEVPNGVAMDVGGVVLVLLDSCWGWLGKDGLAQTLYNRDIPISANISTELENLLFEGRGKDTPTGDEVRTVICASSSPLLPYAKSTNTRKAAYEPQYFKYSSIDVGRLLKTIALWQQRSPDRATLMASACPLYAAQGWTYPILNEEEDDGATKKKKKKGADEEEGWNGERCKLRVILVGAMDRQAKAKGESRYASGETTTPKVPLIDEVSGFQTTFDRGSACTRRCFWNVISYASVKPSKKGDGSFVPGADSGFKLSCVTDGRDPVVVTIGPVIGRVTPTSAVVLLETAADCHLELLCVDQVSGVQYTNAKLMTKNRPTLFTFDQLVPGRAYDVRLATYAGYILPAKHEAPIPSRVELLVRGSFSTPAQGHWGVYSEEQKQLAIELRREAHGLAAIETRVAINADDGTVMDETSTVASTKRIAKETRGITSKTPVALRAFVVGAIKPSWLRLLPHQDALESDDSALGADRVHLANGLATLQAVSDISSRSWGPVPLVIHCNYCVDLSAVSDSALSLVYRAEAAIQQGDMDHANTLQGQALEQLRNAYKLHWGGSSARQLLAHGSHILASSPMLDLLHAFNAPTMRQLSRDLSPFAAYAFLDMVTKLHTEYEASLWDAGLAVPNTDGFLRYSNRAHFLAGGSVVAFTLQPRPIIAQDNFGTSEDGLISEYQFDALATLLGLGQVSSPSNNQEHSLQTLLVVSPLPVVHDDPQLLEGTFLSSEAHGMCYSTSETLRLLDLLCSWLEEVPGREVVILTGGVEVGHGTTIVGRLKNPYKSPDPVFDKEEDDDEDKDDLDILPHTVKAMKVLGETPAVVPAPESAPTPQRSSSPKRSGWGVGGFLGGGTTAEVVQEVKPVGPTPEQLEAERRALAKAEKLRLKKEKKQKQKRQETLLAQQEADRRSEPATIRQLCVGPLVGVPGAHVATPEGTMVSRDRVFSYKHDHLERLPHCGFVEVYDNRLNVQVSREAAVQAASISKSASAPGFVTQAAKLDLADHFTMRSYITEDDTLGTNQLSVVDKPQQSLPVERVIDLSVLKDPTVEEIWRHASAHLSGNRRARADVPQNPEAMDLSQAINESLMDDTVMALYPFVHKSIFVTGTLPLPLNGGSSVEDTLMAAARVLLSNIPREFQDLCPLPSSLALRLIWSKLVHAETRLHEKAVAKGGSNFAHEALPSPVEVVVASLTADAGYLAYFLQQAIEAQALLEHFATILGYNDLNI